MERGFRRLGNVAAVLGTITGVGVIIGFLEKHGLGKSIENTLPTVGWVTFLIVALSGLTTAALAFAPPAHPYTGVKARFEASYLISGLSYATATIVVFIVWGSRTLGWVGVAFVVFVIIGKPFVDRLMGTMTLSRCEHCNKPTLPNANFCAWCGCATATEPEETTWTPGPSSATEGSAARPRPAGRKGRSLNI